MKKMLGCLVFCILIFGVIVVSAEDDYIVKLADNAMNISLFNNTQKNDNPLESRGIITVNREELHEYIDDGYVEYFEPNYEAELFTGEYSDELYGGQWYHSVIKSSYAWKYATYGNEVNVAIIDSGCSEHPDIIENLKQGFDYVNSSKITDDLIGHGTHVSGIIASGLNGEGVIGIANKANIVPLKCFDTGKTAKVSTIATAIYDAVDEYDCKIINMSWGVAANSETLREAINYAHEKGVLLVAAVGNNGTNVPYYPAAYDCVIGVGAVGKNLELCEFSQRNNSVFVVAPGKNILSLGINSDNYMTMDGTSQASPMLVSLIAMMLNIDDSLTIDEIKEILKSCSNDLGDIGYDFEYGYGLIDVQKTIDYMLSKKTCYISPMTINNDLTEVLVYNNMSEMLEGDLIFSLYNENNLFGKCDIVSVALEGREMKKYILENNPDNYKQLKCFFWSDLKNLAPITEWRSYEMEQKSITMRGS